MTRRLGWRNDVTKTLQSRLDARERSLDQQSCHAEIQRRFWHADGWLTEARRDHGNRNQAGSVGRFQPLLARSRFDNAKRGAGRGRRRIARPALTRNDQRSNALIAEGLLDWSSDRNVDRLAAANRAATLHGANCSTGAGSTAFAHERQQDHNRHEGE